MILVLKNGNEFGSPSNESHRLCFLFKAICVHLKKEKKCNLSYLLLKITLIVTEYISIKL